MTRTYTSDLEARMAEHFAKDPHAETALHVQLVRAELRAQGVDPDLYDIVDVKRVGPDELQAIVRCRNQYLSKVTCTVKRVEGEA